MKLYVAKSAGFCFGVKRGVDCVYKMLPAGKIYTYGPIIHNRFVTGDLERRGVRAVDSLEGITDGRLLIRAHGVPRSVYRELEEKKIAYEDCTCPFVRKIQEQVKHDYEKGFAVIIIGSKSHPEIIGINGWCGDTAEIIENINDAKSFDSKPAKNYSVVVQTTFRHEFFEEIINELKKKNIKLSVHNTICSATRQRQDEAEEISGLVDHMIIFGDSISSNTKKLYEISKKNCEKVYLIETVRDLELNIFSADDKIGITAGASTPPAIIKEAVTVMSEELNAEMNTNKTFEEMLDESFVSLHTGDVVKGTVIGISNGEISVNLGYKSDGVVTRAEYSDDPNATPSADYQAGDEIEVYVVRVNDGDGNVLLSKKRLDAKKGYETLEEAFKSGAPLAGKVIEVVKGGLMALINGIKVFVPSSQISSRYVEDLSVFRGKEFNFNILEFDRQKRRIVAGRKVLAVKEEKEQKEKIFDTLTVGDQIDGTVSRLADFGAFVDLGGVDGLIHISELSWGRVKKAKDVVKEGDQVKVTVLKLDREKGKISLSLKDIASNPWNDVEEKYAIGSIVEGKVVRMVPFGAFVELEEGVDGLIHISQIAAKHVVKPDDELKIGEIVKVKVTELDLSNKKISLSKKEVDRAEDAEETADFAEVTAEEPKEEVKEEEVKEDKATEEIKAEEVTAEEVKTEAETTEE